MTEADILYGVCVCLLFAFAVAVSAFIWLTRQSRIKRLLDRDMPAEQNVRPDGYGLALNWKRYPKGWTKKLW